LFKQRKSEQESKTIEKFKNDEKEKRKRLRATFNSMNQLFTEFKDSRRQQEADAGNRNKGNKEHLNRIKQELKEREKRSQQAVEAYKEAQAKKNLLNSEQ
jgi:hypothetical protein